MTDCIAIIGISGAGKSTVAGRVARLLGYEAADSDRELERETGRTIPDIFAEDGESGFRTIEAATAARLFQREGIVVATGGGLPTTDAGRESLAGAFVVWLQLDPERAAQRLLSDPRTETRPLVQGDAAGNLRRMAEARAESYGLAADAIVIVDTMSPDQVADAVVAAYQARNSVKAEAKSAP
jgi:shikimate kinase